MPWIFLASGLFALVSAGPRWDDYKVGELPAFLCGRLGDGGARLLFLAVGAFLVAIAANDLLFS